MRSECGKFEDRGRMGGGLALEHEMGGAVERDKSIERVGIVVQAAIPGDDPSLEHSRRSHNQPGQILTGQSISNSHQCIEGHFFCDLRESLSGSRVRIGNRSEQCALAFSARSFDARLVRESHGVFFDHRLDRSRMRSRAG